MKRIQFRVNIFLLWQAFAKLFKKLFGLGFNFLIRQSVGRLVEKHEAIFLICMGQQ